MDALEEHGAVLRLRHEGESEADGCGNQHDGQDVAGEERLQHVVRDDGEEVVVVGEGAELLHRDIRGTGADEVSRQIARRDPEVEDEADGSGGNRRQQRVSDGVREDAARVLLGAERRERRDDGKRDGRHGDELEQACEDRGHEVEELVERRYLQPTEDGADDQSGEPEDHLLGLPALALAQGLVLCEVDRIFIGICHDIPSFFDAIVDDG